MIIWIENTDLQKHFREKDTYSGHYNEPLSKEEGKKV